MITLQATVKEPTIEVVDPLRAGDWDRQALAHPEANAFHSAAWAAVLQKTYGHQPLYLRCREGDRPLALVPLMQVRSLFRVRRGIALPFSDFCHPLFFDPGCKSEVFRRLCALGAARRWQYLELRGAHGVPPTAVPSVSYHSHQLDLRGGYAQVASRFRPSVRQALRKIERDGQLTATVEHSEAAVRAFFALHTLTRRRHGLPPQPWRFFHHIHREIIRREQGFVVLVRRGGKPVAGMVFFHWGRTAIYKFGASDKTYQELRPNTLALATALQTLAAGPAQALHFGRSSLLNAGLRRFKLTWGATEGKLHYYRYDIRRDGWETTRDRTDGFYNGVFKRLPLVVNRLAGALIYPHLD